MRTQPPTMDVLNSQTANDGSSKQSNFKYMNVVLLCKYCKHQTFLVDEFFPHKVLYILPYINTAQN